MKAMFFFAAAWAGFRNIYCFPVYVIKVSCEKLLYCVSQLKLGPVSAISVGYLSRAPEKIFNKWSKKNMVQDKWSLNHLQDTSIKGSLSSFVIN